MDMNTADVHFTLNFASLYLPSFHLCSGVRVRVGYLNERIFPFCKFLKINDSLAVASTDLVADNIQSM